MLTIAKYIPLYVITSPMQLATLKDGSRDGQRLVVSRALRMATSADAIAPTLQRVLDDWAFHAPQLAQLYDALNQGRARHAFALEPAQCRAPVPRAFQWADGSAYVNHIEPLNSRCARVWREACDLVYNWSIAASRWFRPGVAGGR